MAGLFRGVLREIDGAMENTFEGYLAANRNFAQATRNIEAIQAGSDAAMRGRTEDTVPAFQRLSPQSQRAFRAGYGDLFIEQARKAPRCARTLGGQLGSHLPCSAKLPPGVRTGDLVMQDLEHRRLRRPSN